MGRFSVFVGGVVAWTTVAAAGPREQVTWYLSAWGSPRAVTKSFDVLSETVARETGGGFKIVVAYGESLSPMRENLDSIEVGVIEAAHVCPNNHPGKTPLLAAFELPFLPIADLNASRRLAEVYYRHPEVEKEMARFEAIALFQSSAPRYEFMGRGTPPHQLKDFIGRRLRAPGTVGDAVRALGAQPTPVPVPDIYNAIDRGLVDAATIPFPYAFGAYRIYEVADWYTYNLTAAMPNCFLAVNRPALDRLPEAYRQALMAAVPAAIDAQIAMLNAEEEKWLKVFDEYRLTRVTYSDEQRAELKSKFARGIWEKWIGDTERRGVPARAMLDYLINEAEKASAGTN
ncbi:MAG: hypothetical protein FJX59_03525 [Alphaproteobacteria bacterium]|nr:hypothetical protein [Alphaproteobacteria bacterium]